MLFGRTRFSDIQDQLQINRSLLTRRLERLEEEGLVEKRQYSERPPRNEYLLTEKGRELWSVLSVMWAYGDQWLTDDAPAPVELIDKESGKRIRPIVIDADTGEGLDVATTRRRMKAE